MPAVLLSLISSGSLKWISILVLVFGLVGGLFWQHRKIVENEKQLALQEYNVNQLTQAIKDKELYIDQLGKISIDKSNVISNLFKEKDELENKLSKIVSDIDKNIGAGRDRESSQILKDTIKSLGEMK